jgi:hypothetical protein
MGITLKFEVKENSIQEFAEKWFVTLDRPQDFARREREPINPYYILGQQNIYVRKEIMSIISNDPAIVFTLSDLSRNTNTKLTNTYVYAIEPYDDVLLQLDLIDFKVEVQK